MRSVEWPRQRGREATRRGTSVKLIARTQRIADETRAGEKVNRPFSAAADWGRREFLAGLAAVGADVLISRTLSAAQTTTAAPHRIDVHNHLTPPSYAAELGPKHLISAQVQNWTPAKDLEDMDQAGVATSITSLAPPGVWTGDAEMARRLARSCNDEAGHLLDDHKDRFGMFVNFPLS